MPKTRPPYAPESQQQMVELVQAGRSPEELARELTMAHRDAEEARRAYLAQKDQVYR